MFVEENRVSESTSMIDQINTYTGCLSIRLVRNLTGVKTFLKTQLLTNY